MGVGVDDRVERADVLGQKLVAHIWRGVDENAGRAVVRRALDQ